MIAAAKITRNVEESIMEQEKVGRFIAELRKEKGLTQKNLAAKINVTDKAVSITAPRVLKTVTNIPT